MTEEHLERRAERSSREKFLAALAKVPDVEPEPYDRLAEDAPKRVSKPARRRRRPQRE